MMNTILIRSKNKKAISAIRTLARELKMEVNETSEAKLMSDSITSAKKWEYLVKQGVVVPADPAVKITELAGIWTGRKITLKKLREKAWKTRVR